MRWSKANGIFSSFEGTLNSQPRIKTGSTKFCCSRWDVKSLWIFTLALIAGCSNGNHAEMETLSKSKKEYGDSVGTVQEVRGPDSESIVQDNRRVIYVADIDVSVDDFSLFRRQLPKLVNEHGGYVATVTIDQFDPLDSRSSDQCGTWQIKVRSSQFDSFIESLAKVGTVVRHHQTAKDVSSEYVDLEARIVNKQKMETRVLELIDHSNRSLSEVVSLEKELSRIRGDIERMQGQLNLLKNRTEFATLTIFASQVDPVTLAAATPLSSRVKEAWSVSTEGLQSVGSSLIVFATFVLPWIFCMVLILTPACFVFLTVRKMLRKRRLAGGH